MKSRITLVVMAAGALVLAACSGGGGGGSAAASKTTASGSASSGSSGGGAQNVTVKSLDTLKFDPTTVTVKSGSPVHLTLDNSGAALIHDWVVDSLDGQKITVQADPKQTKSADFTPSKAGSYQFYCSQPGHKEAGMVGTLTVQ